MAGEIRGESKKSSWHIGFLLNNKKNFILVLQQQYLGKMYFGGTRVLSHDCLTYSKHLTDYDEIWFLVFLFWPLLTSAASLRSICRSLRGHFTWKNCLLHYFYILLREKKFTFTVFLDFDVSQVLHKKLHSFIWCLNLWPSIWEGPRTIWQSPRTIWEGPRVIHSYAYTYGLPFERVLELHIDI